MIRRRKRLRPLSPCQKHVMRLLHDANGKVVQLWPTRSLLSLIRRGWIEETATGYRLAKSRVVKPTWLVEVMFKLDWHLREYMWKTVPGNLGSGCTLGTGMYDMTWDAKSAAGAARIASRLKKAIANKPNGTPRVKLTVIPPERLPFQPKSKGRRGNF